jgi:hypothetical protein
MARFTMKETWMTTGMILFVLVGCCLVWGVTLLSQQMNLVMKMDSAVFDHVPSSQQQQQQHSLTTTSYQPGLVESYVIDHARELHLDVPMPQWVPTCPLWTDSTSSPYYQQLQDFVQELEHYYQLIDKFRLSGDDSNNNSNNNNNNRRYDLRHDIRKNNHHNNTNHNVCDKVKLHPQGLPGIFAKSHQHLSFTSSSGYMEPLLPPMRHPNFCVKGRDPYLLALDYLIHDFEALCHKLKPHSRTVFVDMGASLSFHPGQPSPVLFLLQLFRKFGFQFDHVYAYEMALQDPQQVFPNVPSHLDAAFHWINVPVSADPTSRQNPWTLLLENFDEDDLVLVKLDIDTAPLEEKLAHQLLHNPQLAKLIDHFYFEHHVNQQELMLDWGYTVTDSVADSLRLFHKLRQLGVPAHFWV